MKPKTKFSKDKNIKRKRVVFSKNPNSFLFEMQKDYVEVPVVLMEDGSWCTNRKKIMKMAELGVPFTMVSRACLKFMENMDAGLFKKELPTIFKLTDSQWEEAKKLGIAHG